MTVFLLYALFLLALGLRSALAERGRGADDVFYVNGRSSGPWLVGVSIIASCVGGSATLGMAGLARDVGTPAFWWLGSGACGLVLLTLFLAGKVRRSGARTMPEIIDAHSRGESPVSPRRLAAAVIVPAWLAILAAQFTAMGTLTASLTGLEPSAALWAGAALTVAYSLLGGQASVMRSDLVQFGILLAGLCCLGAYLFSIDPAPLLAAKLEFWNGSFPPRKLGYYLAVLGGSYVVCPMLFGRVLSARDERSAMLGCRIGVAGLLLCAVLVTAIGIACRAFAGPEIPADAVLAQAFGQLPAWGALLLVLALVSAVLSSADSCLVTASTVLCNDLLPGGKTASARACRGATLLLGGLGLALATRGHGILDLLLMANDIYVSGVVAPVFCAMLLPEGFKPARNALLAAIFTGGAFGLGAAASGEQMLSVWGMGVSGLVAFAGAFAPAGGLLPGLCAGRKMRR